jgi:hypothetical protein
MPSAEGDSSKIERIALIFISQLGIIRAFKSLLISFAGRSGRLASQSSNHVSGQDGGCSMSVAARILEDNTAYYDSLCALFEMAALGATIGPIHDGFATDASAAFRTTGGYRASHNSRRNKHAENPSGYNNQYIKRAKEIPKRRQNIDRGQGRHADPSERDEKKRNSLMQPDRH